MGVSVIVPPIRIEFTPLPSHIRQPRRTFIASLFIDARRDRRGTKVRVRTSNGKPSKKTGKGWTVIHCVESPREVYAAVKAAREKEKGEDERGRRNPDVP